MNVDFTILLNIIFATNIAFALVVVFFERRSPVHALAWIIALMFLPVVGFLAYILVGRGLSPFTREALKKKGIRAKRHLLDALEQRAGFADGDDGMASLKYFCLGCDSLYTESNDIWVYTDGREKFDALFGDIKNAKEIIHICYFIYKNDNIGQELLELLVEKAREGVTVRLMYDSFGSAFTPHSFFRPLERAGGHVIRFFPSYIGVSFLTLRINFRNHRKIVIIDGKIGYTGGMNVGDDYLGLDKRVKPWRDTHMRLIGPSVAMLQMVFLSDWDYAAQERRVLKPWKSSPLDRIIDPKILNYTYNWRDHSKDQASIAQNFPSDAEPAGKNVGVQILTCGPDDDKQSIKLALIKAIIGAKKYVYLETPYFTPDDSFIDALHIASDSGTDVRIILPGIKDKEFVYRATMSYIRDLLEINVSVYLYPGFMHAKMAVIDDEWSTIGTTNLDIRSFMYNFEDNAFCYGEDLAIHCRKIFEADMRSVMPVTKEWYFGRMSLVRGWESVCRLLTPLL